MLNLLSLFSGIGAYEKALERIGVDYNLVNYCEIDKYASKMFSLIHNVSEDLNLHDVTKVDCNELKEKQIDLITYSFPCTSISVAGRQEGFFDAQGNQTASGLFFDALKIIKEVQPKYAIAENVKNLTSKKFEAEFNTVLSSLDTVGYNNYWAILNATEFGLPQNRERVFIVSIRKDIDDGTFKFPKPIGLNITMKHLLEQTVGEEFYLSNKVQERFQLFDKPETSSVIGTTKPEFRTIGQRDLVYQQDSIMGTLVATDYKQPKQILDKDISVKQLFNCMPTKNRTNPNQGRVYDQDGLAPTLTTMEGGNRQPMVIDGETVRIRKLTPLECFRLMGFDDSDCQVCKDNGISNTQLYKVAGNSIAVPCLEYIFKSLLQ